MSDPADHFYYSHTPAGIAFMEERRESIASDQTLLKDDILSSTEGQQMVKEKQAEAEEDYALAVRTLRTAKHDAATCPDDQDWWYQWMVELHEAQVKRLKGKIWRWRMLQRMDEDGMVEVGQQAGGFNLEAIKAVPVDSLMPYGPVWRSEKRWTYRCPVHNEKTASMVYYRDQNTWHCFGCGEGGSVIDLVMKMENINFIEACRRLTS